jgi:hypothetical protein
LLPTSTPQQVEQQEKQAGMETLRINIEFG